MLTEQELANMMLLAAAAAAKSDTPDDGEAVPCTSQHVQSGYRVSAVCLSSTTPGLPAAEDPSRAYDGVTEPGASRTEVFWGETHQQHGHGSLTLLFLDDCICLPAEETADGALLSGPCGLSDLMLCVEDAI
ncbi:hypothetical protein CTA1_1264 [Colletotrichum tanaceti]|uniref:Uncharacterized protein n=1 Tax=Colletotrichum tanaceti TaxID=1306861 RepID=A0A4U6XH14_9PEZI|nr:hypothetical protein CTA1_1264 [Colletotrichum tanaceti]